MKQLFFTAKEKLEWREVPDPLIDGPGQALVKPLAVARCDLDLPIFRRQTLFRPVFPVGHEFTGEVTAVSDDVHGLSPGDKVIVAFQISCGSCPACRQANSNVCASEDFAAAYGLGQGNAHYGSAFSDLVKVPYAERMLTPIPDGYSPADLASLSDNMTDAWRGLLPLLDRRPAEEAFLQTPGPATRLVRPLAECSYLVVGGLARSIGIYSALMARAAGIGRVSYLDRDVDSLALAERLGIDVIEAENYPKSYDAHDCVFDASADLDGLHCAIRSTADQGTVSSASILWSNKVAMPLQDMYNRGITFMTGRPKALEYTPKVLDLLKSGFDPAAVTTRLSSFKDAAEDLLVEGIKPVYLNED